MKDLIERLERATGPDRELDVAIGFAIGRIRERDGNYLLASGNDSDMVVEPNAYDDHIVAQPLSYYTASVDAALTLVPGLEWIISKACDPVPESETFGKLFYCASLGESQVHYGANPAIALCIAALRARE